MKTWRFQSKERTGEREATKRNDKVSHISKNTARLPESHAILHSSDSPPVFGDWYSWS